MALQQAVTTRLSRTLAAVATVESSEPAGCGCPHRYGLPAEEPLVGQTTRMRNGSAYTFSRFRMGKRHWAKPSEPCGERCQKTLAAPRRMGARLQTFYATIRKSRQRTPADRRPSPHTSRGSRWDRYPAPFLVGRHDHRTRHDAREKSVNARYRPLHRPGEVRIAHFHQVFELTRRGTPG